MQAQELEATLWQKQKVGKLKLIGFACGVSWDTEKVQYKRTGAIGSSVGTGTLSTIHLW